MADLDLASKTITAFARYLERQAVYPSLLDMAFKQPPKFAEKLDQPDEGLTELQKAALTTVRTAARELDLCARMYSTNELNGELTEAQKLVEQARQSGFDRTGSDTAYKQLATMSPRHADDQYRIILTELKKIVQKAGLDLLELPNLNEATVADLIMAVKKFETFVKKATKEEGLTAQIEKQGGYIQLAKSVKLPADIKLSDKKRDALHAIAYLLQETRLLSVDAQPDKLQHVATCVAEIYPQHEPNVLGYQGANRTVKASLECVHTTLTDAIADLTEGIVGLQAVKTLDELKNVIDSPKALPRIATYLTEERLEYLKALPATMELTEEQRRKVEPLVLIAQEAANLIKLMRGSRNQDVDEVMQESLQNIMKQQRLGYQRNIGNYQELENLTLIEGGTVTKETTQSQANAVSEILKEIRTVYSEAYKSFKPTIKL